MTRTAYAVALHYRHRTAGCLLPVAALVVVDGDHPYGDFPTGLYAVAEQQVDATWATLAADLDPRYADRQSWDQVDGRSYVYAVLP